MNRTSSFKLLLMSLLLAVPAFAYVKGVPTIQGVANGTAIPITDSVSDSTASGTLSALCSSISACAANSTVALNMAGQFGASVIIPTSSTLVATLIPDCGFTSADGSTTLWQATNFDSPAGQKLPSQAVTSGTAFSSSIIGCAGASFLRVRVSAFTSGTTTASVRGSFTYDASVMFSHSTGVNTAPPGATQLGALSGGTWTGISGSQKGTAVTTGTALLVQQFKDTGRTNVIIGADGVTPAASDTVITFQYMKGSSLTTGATTYALSSNKTLRIQSITASFTQTSSTAARVRLRLRLNTSGACVVGSPLLLPAVELGPGLGTSGSNQGNSSVNIAIPDGLELSGISWNICLSAVASSAAGTLTVSIVGFEY